MYAGPLGSWWTQPTSAVACHVTTWTDNGDGTASLLHDLGANEWILVTASNPTAEGSAGTDSFSRERTGLGPWTPCGPAP